MNFYQEQSIENKLKRILTHVLKRWNENKSILHPSMNALTPNEHIALKISYIEIKYY